MKAPFFALISILVAGCATTPQGISVVQDFELDRYLGTWYEIARLDHRFERGLSRVSATYTKRSDGGIDVVNRGFNRESATWKEAKGRAYPVGEPGAGSLKVSFFGPFYAGYNVIALDHKNYAYAMVCGPDRKYLWLLSRSKTLPEDVTEKLLTQAGQLGFSIDDLIFVDHQD